MEKAVISSNGVPAKQPININSGIEDKMPPGKGRYTIGRKGSYGCKGYPVVGGEGKVHGCHPTRGAAIRQQAAIYASQNQQKMADTLLELAKMYDSIDELEKSMDGSGDGSHDCPCAGQADCQCDDPSHQNDDEDHMMGKADVSVGDMVSWNSSGGSATGKVTRIIRNGAYNVPNSDFTITGTPDNPAVVIEIYRDDKPTGRMVGHRMDTLRASKSLEGGVLRKMYSVAQNHPGCQGGWAVVDEDGKLEGCFASKDQADAYAAKKNMEEEYEDRIDELKQEMKMKEDVMQQKSIWSSFNPRGIVHRPEVSLFKRDYSSESRRRMAASGQAMPDGSFPIANRTDLANAIQSVGRASNYTAARRHIISRARDLNAIDMLPEDWNVTKSLNGLFKNMPSSAKRANTTGNAQVNLNLFKGE